MPIINDSEVARQSRQFREESEQDPLLSYHCDIMVETPEQALKFVHIDVTARSDKDAWSKAMQRMEKYLSYPCHEGYKPLRLKLYKGIYTLTLDPDWGQRVHKERLRNPNAYPKSYEGNWNSIWVDDMESNDKGEAK